MRRWQCWVCSGRCKLVREARAWKSPESWNYTPDRRLTSQTENVYDRNLVATGIPLRRGRKWYVFFRRLGGLVQQNYEHFNGVTGDDLRAWPSHECDDRIIVTRKKKFSDREYKYSCIVGIRTPVLIVCNGILRSRHYPIQWKVPQIVVMKNWLPIDFPTCLIAKKPGRVWQDARGEKRTLRSVWQERTRMQWPVLSSSRSRMSLVRIEGDARSWARSCFWCRDLATVLLSDAYCVLLPRVLLGCLVYT